MIAAAVVLIGAGTEFYHIAWGTGKAVGQFSLKWLVLFAIFVLFCAAVFAVVSAIVLRGRHTLERARWIVSMRNASAVVRLVLIALVLILPVWFLQRTMWGVVFSGLYFRILLWALMIALLSVLLTDGNEWAGWKPFLAS
ncbi:MAG TPA: hypothetical protein PLF42_00370, partial [Anaerolineales bacterium]|nr:hypothetical protein [Anaerolineales bacterium]